MVSVCGVCVCGVWCVLHVCVDVPMCLFPTAVIVSSQCSGGNRPVRQWEVLLVPVGGGRKDRNNVE